MPQWRGDYRIRAPIAARAIDFLAGQTIGGKASFLRFGDLGQIQTQTACDSLTVRRVRFVEVADLSHLNVMGHRLHRINYIADEPPPVIWRQQTEQFPACV